MNTKSTFKEVSEIWFNTNSVGLSYDYKNGTLSCVNHLNKYIGDKTISEIKSYDIDIIISNLANFNPNTNKPASKSLLVKIVNTAFRIFDFAEDNDLIYKNPAKNKKKKIPRNAPVKIVEGISKEQQQLVIECEDEYKMGAILMMFCGLRTGELLALEWKDFDFEKRLLSINKSVVRVDKSKYAITPGTKNGKNRLVSIPLLVNEWLKEQKEKSTSYLVYCNDKGNFQTLNQWKLGWRRYQNRLNYYYYQKRCIENGVKVQGYHSPNKIPQLISTFNSHQLRHTYATLLYISGVDILTASELLGHSDITTTLKIYIHLERKFKELNISKFDEYIKSDLDLDKKI